MDNLNDLSNNIQKQAGSILGVYGVLESVPNTIKKMTDNVLELNSAMNELSKISGASSAAMDKYFNEAAESAKKYGSSISELISATAEWSRQGYSLSDSKTLSEISTIYQNIGDGIDKSTASQTLSSALNSFELEVTDAMGVIDKLNAVSKQFGINSVGISDALHLSADSFYEANTDISKSIALIAGTSSGSGDIQAVGTMWDDVASHIRDSSQELEGIIKNTTGFEIVDNDNSLKDIYDIVVGIGKEWKNLSDTEQNSILQQLASSENGNALNAAFNSIDTIKAAYLTAENSAGSALNAQREYEEGIQYSIDRLAASFQELSHTVFDSDFIKGIVDFGNTSIHVLDNITERFGVLPTLLAGGSFAAFAKNFDYPCNKGYLDFRQSLSWSTMGENLP